RVKDSVFDDETSDDKIPPEYRLSFHTREFYEERIDRFFKKFTQNDQQQSQQQVIYFHDADKPLLNQILQEASFTRSELRNFGQLKREVEHLKEQIEASQGDDQERKLILKKYQGKIIEIEEEKSKLEQKLGEIKRQHNENIRKKTELEKQIIDLRNQFAIAKPIKNTLEMTEKLIGFFQDFIEKLLDSKVESLQKQFSHSVKTLLPDPRFHRVKIDHRFNIKIYDREGRDQAIGSFSSGQKQIIATALMQAISKVANIDSFVCVDTPLARIDRSNREKIIKHYYPAAARQVIILATDSEVAPHSEELELLKPYLAKSYTILNNDDKKTSYFTEGYILEEG
ncbi:MAG: hypothetical protein AAFU64_16275, partial [Bacteroidota bacterium]